MPAVINIGIFNVNSPQPSAGVFVGQNVVNGMDGNRKYNLGFGGQYGVNNVVAGNISNNVDSFEVIDGAIFDQDFKGNLGSGNI